MEGMEGEMKGHDSFKKGADCGGIGAEMTNEDLLEMGIRVHGTRYTVHTRM